MQKNLIFQKLLDKFDFFNYNLRMIDKLKRGMTGKPLYKALRVAGVSSAGKDFWRSVIRFFEFTGLWVEEAG
jgi:hypothetical protein